MSKAIKPGDLGAAIVEELTLYHKDLTERVDAVGERAVKKLVKLTKRTAPVSKLKRPRKFKKNIAWKRFSNRLGHTVFVWYVKPPDHRLTHLIVHGHATVNGGRTKGDPFLKNALDDVLPEYEKEVEEALKQ